MDLTPEVVFSLIQSDEEFPIDFDDAWRWIEYSSKQKGEENLTTKFDEGVDYIEPSKDDTSNSSLNYSVKRKKGGNNRKIILLTVECFKQFCMTAGTPKGREVRRYFLKCEADLKQKLKEEQEQNQSNTKKCLVGSIVSKDIVSRILSLTMSFTSYFTKNEVMAGRIEILKIVLLV